METIAGSHRSWAKLVNSVIDGVQVLDASIKRDQRGTFANILSHSVIENKTSEGTFQIYHSHNLLAGTLRGFHFQQQPSSEFKFVYCISGELCDILVDVRITSSTYGLTNVFNLKSESGKILLIPPGVAHGYQTLTDNTALLYVITGEYIEALQMRLNPLSDQFFKLWPLPVTAISSLDKSAKTWPTEF